MLSYSLFSSAIAVRGQEAESFLGAVARHCARDASVQMDVDGSISWQERVGLMPRTLRSEWVQSAEDVIEVTVRSMMTPVSEVDGHKVYAFLAPFEGVRTDFMAFALSAPFVKPCRLGQISPLVFADLVGNRRPSPNDFRAPYIRSVEGSSNGLPISFTVDNTNASLADETYGVFTRSFGLKNGVDIRRIGVRVGGWDVAVERNLFSEFCFTSDDQDEPRNAVRNVYNYLRPLIRVTSSNQRAHSLV